MGDVLDEGRELELDDDGSPKEPEEGAEPQLGEDGKPIEKGKYIPIERFNPVYGKMKEYEKALTAFGKLGKPEEVQARLSKLAEWEKAVEEQRKQAAMGPDDQAKAKRALQLQKELYEVMPSLKLLEKIEALEKQLGELRGRSDEANASAILKDHSAKFAGVLKEAKIDGKFQGKIEEYIVSQMTEDQRAEFVGGNFDVAKEIFDKELKDGLFSTLRGKATVPVPIIRNSPGGTPPKGQEKKAMTMKEAEDIAWGRLKGEE